MSPTVPLSLAHLSELDVPPLELVELAARAGFASIGLRTSPASPGGVVYPLTHAPPSRPRCDAASRRTA